MASLDEHLASQLRDEDAIELLERRGYVVHRPLPPGPKLREVDLSHIRGDRVRIAVVSDTHLGSKYQQVTALERFLRYAKNQRVRAILHCGDVTDGPYMRHRNPDEVWLHTWTAMRDYAVEALPRLGVPWYVIAGNHDDWWTLDGGPDIVEAICAARDDMTYLGRAQGFLRFGEVVVELAHPNMGTAYALSYHLQRHVEGMPPEEKPHIYLAGNWHKAVHLPAYRNVEAFAVPAFQSRTHWMRGKRLASVVGGLILEFGAVTKGLAPSVRVEWVLEREPMPDDWPQR